jgi:glycosyltransferase involved in cell wall biosynthesis
MRIAYVTVDAGFPVFGHSGACVHVREFVAALHALGAKTTIIAARRGAQAGSLPAQIREIDTAAAQLPPVSDRSVKERAYMRIGISAADELIRLHRAAPFDLIYERYSLWSAAGVRAARRLGVPCFVEVNSPLIVEQMRYRKLHLESEAQAIEAEVFRNADRLLAVSEQVRAYAIAKGARPEGSIVLSNGVDPSRFHSAVAKHPLAAAEGKFVIGFLGSLKPWHGMEPLLEAFRSIHAADPKTHLLIIGDGPMRPWIEGYACGASFKDDISITGWVDHDLVPSLLQGVDAAVVPYPELDDFYFSPLKLYEYMAVGRPIVASAIGQIAEVLEHGTTGRLSRPGDASDLAGQIELLRRDPAMAAALGRAASRRARAFTWEGKAKRVLALAASLKKPPYVARIDRRA